MSQSQEIQPPIAFISYSHDTPAHKRWVAELATKLMDNGVEVLLDQWEIGPGDDVPKFMERAVTKADCVLMVCSEAYVRKADDGKGGVGYEAMIVTGELVNNLGTSKFVPIIRQENGGNALPKSMGTRFYVNLNADQEFEKGVQDLLHKIHKVPKVKKPALGKNPFAISFPNPSTPTKEDGAHVPPMTNFEPTRPPQAGNMAAAIAYSEGLSLARSRDLVGWRQLVKRAKLPIQAALLACEKKYLESQLTDATLPSMVLEAATVCAPLIAVALAGVESGEPKFSNQTAILDELLIQRDWVGSGYTVVVDLPDALVFVYQALHGAVAVATQQAIIAVDLACARVHRNHQQKAVVLWEDSKFIGWPDSLGNNCHLSWKFLVDLPKHWPWLIEIFGSEHEYQTALCAYYSILNVLEFAEVLARGDEQILDGKEIHLQVPLCFHTVDEAARRKAYRMLLQSAGDLRRIWQSREIEEIEMLKEWPKWIRHCAYWLSRVYNHGFFGEVIHKHLFEELPPKA